MSKKRIIAMVGMMGVGKTTIGLKLAKKLQYYFIDLDQEIEDRLHCSINEIFEKKGEAFFREIESKIIAEIIERDEEIIFSLGGGAYVDLQNRKNIQKKAIVIWLHANLDEIFFRTSGKNNRPLLKNKNNVKKQNDAQNRRQIIQKLITNREPFYRECDLDFDTTNCNQEILINNIIQQLKSLRNEK